MNLDAYLPRLGIARPPAPTLDALRRLHVAHLAAFPFHMRTDTPIEPAQVRSFAKELFGIDLGDGQLLFERGEGG